MTKDTSRASDTGGNMQVPATVRLGVTGHRRLVNEQLLEISVRNVMTQLDTLLRSVPHSFVVVSPLAEGADRLVADVVLEWPVASTAHAPALEAILPLPQAEYMQDFDREQSRGEFKALLQRAQTVKLLDPASSREESYEQAGLDVVDNCDVLIAIWDGRPAQGKGGTEEIVGYARRAGRWLFWINAETGIVVEEMRDKNLLDSVHYLHAYNDENVRPSTLRSRYEKQRAKLDQWASDAKLSTGMLEPITASVLPYFVRADRLADSYQRKHAFAGIIVYVLAALAVAVAATQVLVWLEVAFIGAILLVVWLAHAGDWHRKWTDYRFLAERLRAAFFLCVAGIEYEAPALPPFLSLSRRSDEWMVRASEWILSRRPAFGETGAIQFDALRTFLRVAWIDDQQEYYAGKSASHSRRYSFLETASVLVFAVTLIAAILHATGIAKSALPQIGALGDLPKTLAIVLPAVAASVNGICSFREYLRISKRYDHMARFLASISEQMQRAKDMRRLAPLLRQAYDVMVRENQDWRVVVLSEPLHVV